MFTSTTSQYEKYSKGNVYYWFEVYGTMKLGQGIRVIMNESTQQ